MSLRISLRGRVRPWVVPIVRPPVCPSDRPSVCLSQFCTTNMVFFVGEKRSNVIIKGDVQ